MGVGSHYRQTVAGCNEKILAENHIAIAIAVRGGAKIDRIEAAGLLNHLMGVYQIGIRMTATKILFGYSVDDGARFGSKLMFQDLYRIRTGNRMHRVKTHTKHARVEQLMNAVKIENMLHQIGIICNGVDDADLHRVEGDLAQGVDIDIVALQCLILTDAAGVLEDRFGHCLWGGPTVGSIELDAEILIGSGRIVTGGEDDAALGLIFTDHAGGGGCRQQSSLTNDDLADAVGGRHTQDGLYRRPVVIAAIAANHQRSALQIGAAVEDRLDEILKIVRLLEAFDLLTQSGGAGALIGERLGGYDL